jgi:hypothetical protein
MGRLLGLGEAINFAAGGDDAGDGLVVAGELAFEAR